METREERAVSLFPIIENAFRKSICGVVERIYRDIGFKTRMENMLESGEKLSKELNGLHSERMNQLVDSIAKRMRVEIDTAIAKAADAAATAVEAAKAVEAGTAQRGGSSKLNCNNRRRTQKKRKHFVT